MNYNPSVCSPTIRENENLNLKNLSFHQREQWALCLARLEQHCCSTGIFHQSHSTSIWMMMMKLEKSS